MVTTDVSWWSLTCTPVSGSEARSQLEDILYSAGCGGIWDHTPINDREGVCLESSASSLLTAYFTGEMQPLLLQLAGQLENQELVFGRPQILAVEN